MRVEREIFVGAHVVHVGARSMPSTSTCGKSTAHCKVLVQSFQLAYSQRAAGLLPCPGATPVRNGERQTLEPNYHDRRTQGLPLSSAAPKWERARIELRQSDRSSSRFFPKDRTYHVACLYNWRVIN